MSDLLTNWETVIPHLAEVFRNKIGVSEQELVIIDLNFDNLVEYCCLCLFCRGTSDDLREMKNVDQRFGSDHHLNPSSSESHASSLKPLITSRTFT